MILARRASNPAKCLTSKGNSLCRGPRGAAGLFEKPADGFWLIARFNSIKAVTDVHTEGPG